MRTRCSFDIDGNVYEYIVVSLRRRWSKCTHIGFQHTTFNGIQTVGGKGVGAALERVDYENECVPRGPTVAERLLAPGV